jgi:hypothetical protein
MGTESNLAENREIAWVFFGDVGKYGDMGTRYLTYQGEFELAIS